MFFALLAAYAAAPLREPYSIKCPPELVEADLCLGGRGKAALNRWTREDEKTRI